MELPQGNFFMPRVDEDLFDRAAEINSPPLILTGSEAGFELQSTEKSQENTCTTVCSE